LTDETSQGRFEATSKPARPTLGRLVCGHFHAVEHKAEELAFQKEVRDWIAARLSPPR
jgi:hypothetical protein